MEKNNYFLGISQLIESKKETSVRDAMTMVKTGGEKIALGVFVLKVPF